MVCKRCPLREDSVFGTFLSRTDRQAGQSHSIRRFAKRQVVLREGEVPEGIYCVRSGLLKRSVGDPQGNRKILEILGPGDLLGVESISGNGSRAAEAATLEASELCFFHRRDLPELVKGTPDFAMALAAYAAERLARAERELADLFLKNARQRLANALLTLGRRFGKRTPRGILLDLPISRSELANFVGIALATSSRLCRELKDEGVIRTRGRQMFIVGWGKLEEDDG
jgi:CRP-like cAMP-binding protein